MTTQKFTIHTKINNDDVILHPKTEVSQVEGFTQSVNGLIDTAIEDIDSITNTEIASYWNGVTPGSDLTVYVTQPEMESYVAAEIAKITDADEVQY